MLNTYEIKGGIGVIFAFSFCLLSTIIISTGFGADESVLTGMKHHKAKTPIVKTTTVCDEFVKRLRTIPFNPGDIIIPKLGFATSHPSETYESTERIIKSISKDYSLTQPQFAEISEFANPGSRYYVEDVDQDGRKDIIVERVRGTMKCHRYLYYHVNNDKTLTRIEGPDTSKDEDEGSICWNTLLGFVSIGDKTYIAIVDNYLHNAASSKPKTIIELFSLKDFRSRKGLGKIQIEYECRFQGKLKNGVIPSFHVLESRADAIVRQLSRPVSTPLATSVMNNPEWTYHDKKADRITEAIDKKYYSGGLVKNQSQYQLLDIDNDGEKEIVCHLIYDSGIKGSKYSRMVIIRMGPSGPVSHIDVDKYFPELRALDTSLPEPGVYSDYDELDMKGSEYFPLSDGKENYIVKVGKSHKGWRESSGYILGVYKLKNKKIALVDAMAIIPRFVFMDAKEIK